MNCRILRFAVFAVLLISLSVSCTRHHGNANGSSTGSAIDTLTDSDDDSGSTTAGKSDAGGTNGNDGADGADGTDSLDGADGTDGLDGADSADAVDGSNGQSGADVSTGVDAKTQDIPDTTKPLECGPGASGKCSGKQICANGYCVSPCSSDAARATGVGCKYVAVQLENPASAGQGLSVVVINTSGVDDLTLTVKDTVGGVLADGFPITILAKEHKTVVLPDRPAKGTFKEAIAYELSGDIPFVAIQVSASKAAENAYSSDVTQLLPVGALGREYLAVTGKLNGFVTVVAPQSKTLVSVRPSAVIAAGKGIKALQADTLYTFELALGDVLNLRAKDGDLTGTEVLSTLPVAVFSGSTLSRSDNKCCADHMEQQLPPVTAWGKTIVAQRSTPRGNAQDHWRVVAAVDDTTVNFETVSDDPPPVTLDRGQWVEITSTKSLVVTASAPVMVAQILASAHEITLQGSYCSADADCDPGQTCIGAVEGQSGVCRAKCKIQQADCPKAVYGCHELYGEVEGLQVGEGLCYRNTCNAGEPPCTVGTICVSGDAASACYEACALNKGCSAAEQTGEWCGMLSGQAVCAPKSCENDIGSCQGNAVCELVPSGKHVCRFKCQPPQSCPDTDYRCLSDRFFPPLKKWFTGAICIAPSCLADADCPKDHACSMTGEAPHQCKPIGDPSLLIATPVAQYRDQHNVMVPEGYGSNYLGIIAPNAATVLVDGTAVPSGTFFPVGASHKIVTRELAAGNHRIIASEPVAVAVYGYGIEVSYGTQGTMALNTLWGGTLGDNPDPDPELVDGGGAEVSDKDVPEVIAPTVTWNKDIKALVTLKCTPCHIGSGNSGGLNMNTPDFVTLTSDACAGLTMGQAMALKIQEKPDCTGTRMPPTGDVLPAKEAQLIKDWVNAGFP